MKKKPYGNSIANVLSDDIYICLIQLRRKVSIATCCNTPQYKIFLNHPFWHGNVMEPFAGTITII